MVLNRCPPSPLPLHLGQKKLIFAIKVAFIRPQFFSIFQGLTSATARHKENKNALSQEEGIINDMKYFPKKNSVQNPLSSYCNICILKDFIEISKAGPCLISSLNFADEIKL